MKHSDYWSLICVAGLCFGLGSNAGLAQSSVSLPAGVHAVWDLDQAYREKTPTRERVCLNGLWRWQPAAADANEPPAERWGFFKVPGCWPGRTDWLQKDCQTLYPHPDWKKSKPAETTAAWYQREFTVPANWAGRRITLDTEYLNSQAMVFVDGQQAGEIRFPGGEADLTALCRPGTRQVLSLLVRALPLKALMRAHNDTSSPKEVQGSVERRGLCGDVFLVSTPATPRLSDVKVDTSVRKWQLTLGTKIENAPPDTPYVLRAEITDKGRKIKEFTSPTFQAADLKDSRFSLVGDWKPDKLWDLNTPGNLYEVQVSLLDAKGRVLDTHEPVRFGFREFWIDGRDFRLNGTRIFLTCVPLDNAQIGAAWATYAAARESLERLQSFGINFVYTHNYGCEPGVHLSFAEVLRAADDVGMLVAFSQPHFAQYDWKAADADRSNGYLRHAEFYVRAAQNHPAVVTYAMSHNATGTNEEMDPDLIDGIYDQRSQWSANNVKLALRAEAIVKQLDPSRIVYHHSSGNLGSMHTANFYANFAPVQEMSDWFEHWATKGVKPVFLCEYGVPITWDWAMYRGWYQGRREFGSAKVPWEFCLAEWDAQFFGDRAYRISEEEKSVLRWEAQRFRAGQTWCRWDYPRNALDEGHFEQRQAVMARYLSDNLRAFRTWGVSAVCPWDHGQFWKLRDGARLDRQDLKVDWEHLQRPGFSPDYIEARYLRMDLAGARADWIATSAAQALLHNNRPLLAYIAGPAGRFTGKDHNYLPGETIEKQVVVINNSREPVTADCAWSLGTTPAQTGSQKVAVETGEQARIPLRFALPATQPPGACELTLSVKFSKGEPQQDSFTINLLPPSSAPKPDARIALYDPHGETDRLLQQLGIQNQKVAADADLSRYDILVVGKEALTVDGPGPDVGRVRAGLKVIVFEQTAAVLEKRFGFRVAEYGLRQVFPRVGEHPLLAGLNAENLHDWRGAATILTPRLQFESSQRFNGAPTVQWCGIPVTRVWRCGSNGNVASVLIEKPARGDFLPLLDGGFALQYAPLLLYREGRGLVLFCQMDVSGRTRSDPAAECQTRNMFAYVSASKPAPSGKAVYVGEEAGKTYLEKAGLTVGGYAGGKPSSDQVLIVGPGGGKQLAASAPAIREWLQAGGALLAIGLDAAEANSFLPFQVATKKTEHIAAYFEPFGVDSPLAGIAPADLLNRAPRDMPLVSDGAVVVDNGVLARGEKGNVVFCQLVPWQFNGARQGNLRRTFRRTAFVLNRLLAGLGVAGSTPILPRFSTPVEAGKPENRWLDGLYLDQPEEWDDPYRFFCW